MARIRHTSPNIPSEIGYPEKNNRAPRPPCTRSPLRAPRACCRVRLRAEAHAPDVHALPDARTGEGVPLQSLPDAPTAHRDRARARPHRTTDQDLVPEPTHEVEEREQSAEADRPERLRPAGGRELERTRRDELGRLLAGQGDDGDDDDGGGSVDDEGGGGGGGGVSGVNNHRTVTRHVAAEDLTQRRAETGR